MILFTGKWNGKGGLDYTVYCMSKEHKSKNSDLRDVRYEEYRDSNAVKTAIKERDQAVKMIMDSVSADNVVDQIMGYNDWLTHNNQYCSTYPDPIGDLSYVSISALTGSTGSQGPVCSGYARAFKVLCDKAGIPCVLVDGFPYENDEGHMWNYVKVEGEWYAVDVTWNDPFDGSKEGAVSGYESNYWILLGSETLVYNGEEQKDYRFIESHPVNNNPGVLCFTNGPALSKERYPIYIPTVTFEKEGTTVMASNPQISYSYSTSQGGTYTNGLPINVGTYWIRATVASSKEEGYRTASSANTLKLTIKKAPRAIPAPTVKTEETTDESVTLNPVAEFSGSNDGTVEYARSETGTLPSSGWQKDPKFTGLKRNSTYYFFARVTNGKNYEDASSDKTAETTKKTKLPKPTLKRSQYAYTGGNITAELDGFDESIMSITGQSASACGSYQAKITLESADFIWEDDPSEPPLPVSLDWKIMLGRTLSPLTADPDKITENHIVLNASNITPAESVDDGTLEYGYAMEADSSQVKNWQAGIEFANLESGTTYYFFARITGGTEYIDMVSATLPLTTKKIKLAKPALSDDGNYTYNGSLIQASISGFRAGEMDASGNVFRNAGIYTAEIRLKDARHYEWEDGSSDPVSFSWKIAKKPVTVKAADKSRYYGKENPELTLQDLGEGVLAGNDSISDLKVTLTTAAEKNSPAGNYPITGTAADDGNYEVTVEQGTLTMTRASSSSGGGGGGTHSGSAKPDNSNSILPSYVVKGEWFMVNGSWRFSDASGNTAANSWVAAYNPYAAAGQQNYDWFYFGQDGNMLTGWVWIADEVGVQRCYYFNPNSDGHRGTMLTNAVIDGYTIDANGWWTVDGIVQTK